MKPDLKALILMVLGAGALGVACVDTFVLYEGQPCPCAKGYVCCENECTEGSSCSKKRSPTSSGDDDDDYGTTSGASDSADGIKTLVSDASPACLTADESAVYWMNADGTISGSNAETPKEVRSRLNPPVTQVQVCTMLRTADALYVATAEDDSVYWLSVSFEADAPVIGARFEKVAAVHRPTSLLEDETSLYVLDGTSGEVRRITKRVWGGVDSGAPEVTLLGKGSPDAYSLVLAGDALFWFDEGGLRRMAKTGGEVTTIAPLLGGKPGEHARDLQAGGGMLFWVIGASLVAVPIAGGTPQPLAFRPHSQAIDADVTTPSYRLARRVYSFASTEQGLILAHPQSVGFVPFEGGDELRVFGLDLDATYDEDPSGVSSLRVDTSRFLWIGKDSRTIRLRPRYAFDPVSP